MGKTFNGKKAAPFKKGGGRSKSSPHTAKGTPRKKNKGSLNLGTVYTVALIVLIVVLIFFFYNRL